MSVNYHAFQNRGVLFTNHEKACQQWRDEFTGYTPSGIAAVLHLETDDTYLYLNYFQQLYRLCLADGCLEKKREEEWDRGLFFNESMVIYHLLHYTKDMPVVSGKWVASNTIDGVVSRNRNVPDPLLTPFTQKYTGKTEDLDKLCQAAGGKKIASGDVAYEFEAFPFLHLRLVFWDADEDFPAQTQILVDACVTDFVHYETVGCMISDLLEKLQG